jgi:hypothetical protein
MFSFVDILITLTSLVVVCDVVHSVVILSSVYCTLRKWKNGAYTYF